MNYWYGRDHRVETNEVGIHEFVDFCRMVGAKPYLAANLTAANLSYGEAKEIELTSFDVPLPANASAVGFSSTPQSCNTFEDTDAVNPSPAAPLPFDGKSLRFELPPASVVSVTLQP